MKKHIITNAATVTLFLLGAIFFGAAIASATTLRVVQTPTLHLYTGQSAVATTMRVTPYPKDLDGTKLTITDFGTNPTVTVDPKISGTEEIEGFTAIVDNGDGTATLTGVTRNLLSKYPYTTAGTGRSHGSGATVVFGNNPQIYGRLAAPENTQTWTAVQTYSSTTLPRVDLDPGSSFYSTAPGTVFVTLDQLNRTGIAGAVNGSLITQGLFQAARPVQAASSTGTGSTGALLVLTTSIATSSPSLNMSTSSVVVTRNDSRISPRFISTSTADTYTMGNLTVTATTTMATSTQIGNTLGGLMPTGSITAYASTTPPGGWLLANGASVLRTDYPQLFAVVGVSYGTVDGTHFTLPNLLGRTPVMASSTANMTQTGGEDRHTQTIAEMPAHTHTIDGNAGSGVGAGTPLMSTGNGASQSAPTGSTGGGTSFNVRDPYLAVQYIIKY